MTCTRACRCRSRTGSSASRRSVVALFRWIERLCVRGACAVVAISPAVARAARSAVAGRPLHRAHQLLRARGGGRQPRSATRSAPATAWRRTRSSSSIPAHSWRCRRWICSSRLSRACSPPCGGAAPLVGGAEPELSELRATAERLGIAERVILEPARPQAEIPGYLAAADALVSPRVQGINPPGKLLSYLASGRPVVATDTLVHNQLLNGECAILTRPDAAGPRGRTGARAHRPAADGEAHPGAAGAYSRGCAAKAARDAAYEEIASAVFAAASRRRRPAARRRASSSSRPSRRHRP